LPRPVSATPTVAALPVEVLGWGVDASAFPPPPPQPATASAAMAAAAAVLDSGDLQARSHVRPLVHGNVVVA